MGNISTYGGTVVAVVVVVVVDDSVVVGTVLEDAIKVAD